MCAFVHSYTALSFKTNVVTGLNSEYGIQPYFMPPEKVLADSDANFTPLFVPLYLILSELRIVIVFPSILIAPFSSNSDRQRRSENF